MSGLADSDSRRLTAYRSKLKIMSEHPETLHVKLLGGDRKENYIPTSELKDYRLGDCSRS